MIKTHRFHGVKYHIRTVEGYAGFCDAPEGSAPSIAIMIPLKEFEGLETALHESLHACNFDKSEAQVTQTAHDIARFLWRLGYRVKSRGK
jgi:hypothetical protein